MQTLNREYSKNVLKLNIACKCSICGHNIKFASKTYYLQTEKYIGLDCWENEKEKRKIERQRKYDEVVASQRLIDLKSNHISEIKKRVTVKVKLEKVIFLYMTTYGYQTQNVYLNIFRTENGDIVTYKGKNLYYAYLEMFGYNLLDGNAELYKEFYEKFEVSQNTETNYDSMSERSQHSHSEYMTKDVIILKNADSIQLTGTVKEYSLYNDIKQTLIQRPKLKNE